MDHNCRTTVAAAFAYTHLLRPPSFVVEAWRTMRECDGCYKVTQEYRRRGDFIQSIFLCTEMVAFDEHVA